jgi:(E)-4-hydroxy-3-methylbut-2-enyl-diphosphate synthase
VASEAKDRGIPIRIGVNGGSLDPELYDKYGGKVTPEAMVESALREIAYFDEVGFDQIKISVKASNVPLMVEAYRQLSEVTDHPLHLGVTEAGPLPNGLLKATAGIAALLLEGIGDTIRYSLTADPVEEARAGRQLLEALGLRERKNVDLIACPSCGRAEIDVIDVANRAMKAFGERQIPLQVAVMGCVVNGPGATLLSFPKVKWLKHSLSGPSSSTSMEQKQLSLELIPKKPNVKRQKIARCCLTPKVMMSIVRKNASSRSAKRVSRSKV